jgi:hypothetical protein
MKFLYLILAAIVISTPFIIGSPVAAGSIRPGWAFHWYPYHYGNLSGQIPQWINETYMQQFIAQSEDLHYHNYQQVIQNETSNKLQNDLLGNYLWFYITSYAKGDDQARIAISLVRNLPSRGTFEERAVGPYQIQYPYVSFGYTSSGVCSDRSVALAWLLSRLGYDSAILWFNGGPYGSHMATGIRVNDSAPYNFQKTGYALLEISDPAVPTAAANVDSGSVTVIKVGSGTQRMNLSKEWADGQRWAWLLNNYHNLTQAQYKEFNAITGYYGC